MILQTLQPPRPELWFLVMCVWEHCLLFAVVHPPCHRRPAHPCTSHHHSREPPSSTAGVSTCFPISVIAGESAAITSATTSARYIAAKTGLPLVTARLDSLVSSLLGSTAKNIRKVFEYAAQQECVLFLDEFDVVAKRRDDENELGELRRVVNSLLQNIDSFGEGSILIAATNHQDLLDPAVWRRFNKVIEVPMPTNGELEAYAHRFIQPYMSVRIKPKLYSALEGLSFSDFNTATKNAFYNATLEGSEEGFTAYHLARETYVPKHHSLEDQDAFIRYLIEAGCTLREINEKSGISMRRIQAVSRSVRRYDPN